MPEIITLSHQKGGVGKSTLTFNLAQEFKNHLKTAVVDLDPQGTLSQLKPLIKDFDVINEIDIKDIKKLPYEIVFIDTPPYLSDHLPGLFKVSDLIIVPTKAGIADLMAIRSTIKIIKEAEKSDKALIVLNMIKSSSNIVEDIKKMVSEHDITVANTQIKDRVIYTKSLLEKGVGDNSKARREMEDLSEEIIIKLKS